MKILYIHQYSNTPTMSGSTRSYEFAKRLVSRGDTVYMVTSDWQGASKNSFSSIDGINIFWAPIKYSNKMSYLNRILVFFSFLWYVFSIGLKLNYDIIIASSTPLTIAIPAIILKKLKSAKMIFEIRDLWPDLPIAIGAIKSKIIIILAKFLEKIAYKNADHIICLSPGMKNELIIQQNLTDLTVITNLCDLDRFQNINNEYRLSKQLPISDGSPLVIYAGVFGRINGVIYLVEIANKMKKINSEVRFLLVGNGFGKKEILDKSKIYNIYNKTLFYSDYIPKNQIPQLLSKATIISSLFIDIPQMENNSANKFFDGLAAGKPIMLNYGGWQKELLENSGAGFIIPKNDSKLAAEEINKYIKDKDKLMNMSNAALKIAKKFDVNSNYKKFEKVIDNVYGV